MQKFNTEKSAEVTAKTKSPKSTNNIWNSAEKLSIVKAPPSAAALAVPKIPDNRVHSINQTIIEKAVIENERKHTLTNLVTRSWYVSQQKNEINQIPGLYSETRYNYVYSQS